MKSRAAVAFAPKPALEIVELDLEGAMPIQLGETMKDASLCALGGFTSYPVLSAVQYWPGDLGPTA